MIKDIIVRLEGIIQEMNDELSEGLHTPLAFETSDKLYDLKLELERRL